MEQSKVLYFQETYSRMSDDELAYLIAMRGDTLVEEARVALSAILQTRNFANVEAEIKETVADLSSQAESEHQRIQQQQQRLIRKAFHLFCAFFLTVGIALLVFGDYERGPILVAGGIIGAGLFELRRLAGRFVVTLFKMN